MTELCPKTGEMCAVKMNIARMRKQGSALVEVSLSDFEQTADHILQGADCEGATWTLGDADHGWYSGTTAYCGSVALPEVRAVFEQFETVLNESNGVHIENIGKRGAI